jgi:hypothetical protein
MLDLGFGAGPQHPQNAGSQQFRCSASDAHLLAISLRAMPTMAKVRPPSIRLMEGLVNLGAVPCRS